MAGNGTGMCTTDGELIQRAGRREFDAFEALYRRHSGRVYGMAVRRLRDRGRAEDATQETFAAIWRSAASYRPDRGSGAAWLYTVARNTIVDRLRVRPELAGEPPEAQDDAPGPANQVEADWLRTSVHGAVEQLPENERVLIELAYWKGLSQSEIAAFTGIPLGTVKTRTRSALARLADTLEQDELL
jgi:RNA polymerase sigma-70 factor (ECF subfamily)